MVSNLQKNWMPQIARGWTLVFTLGLLLLPLIAFAQDHDDKPIPLSPQAQKIQLWTYGIVTLAATLFLVWYFLRRWQLRNAPGVSGTSQHQD